MGEVPTLKSDLARWGKTGVQRPESLHPGSREGITKEDWLVVLLREM